MAEGININAASISAVVVSYQSRAHIVFCLDSLMGQSCAVDEVILVDNASSDGTADLVRNRFPKVRIIVNDANVGAAQARNQGIAASCGDWVLTLDADTRVDRGFVDHFKKTLNGKNDAGRVGVVAPKILYPDGRTIYSLGHQLTFLRRFYDVGKAQADSGTFRKLDFVFGACSAAAFYKKAMLEAIKEGSSYFRDDFFFIAEDVDVSWRGRKKGWQVLLCADAVAYHAGDSSGTPDRKRTYYAVRNRFLMMARNDDFLYLLALAVPLFFYEVFRFLALVCKGRGGVALRAAGDAFHILGKRKNPEVT